MSLNLHDVAVECINELNSNVAAQWYVSIGNAENTDGTVTPAYAAPVAISVQMQALTQRDLRHTDALNLQGILANLWFDGASYGVVRPTQKGGDKFVINGQTWLVLPVPELWQGPGWTHVIVQLQVLA